MFFNILKSWSKIAVRNQRKKPFDLQYVEFEIWVKKIFMKHFRFRHRLLNFFKCKLEDGSPAKQASSRIQTYGAVHEVKCDLANSNSWHCVPFLIVNKSNCQFEVKVLAKI